MTDDDGRRKGAAEEEAPEVAVVIVEHYIATEADFGKVVITLVIYDALTSTEVEEVFPS